MRRSAALAIATASVAALNQFASAATITQAYTSVQYSTTSTFATGSNTVTVAGGTTAISIPVGDYFRFSTTLAISGVTNPDAGSAYDQANQAQAAAANGDSGAEVALPANLGISGYGFQVGSSDLTGSSLKPIVSATNALVSRATGPAGYTFTTSFGPGFVVGGNVGVGAVGTIGGVNLPPSDYTSSTAIATLGYFTTAARGFSNLLYQATASGTVTLTPTLRTDSTSYFTETAMGAVDGSNNITANPTYTVTPVSASDSIPALAPLVITVTSPITTPTTIVSLSATATNTSVGTIAVKGSNGGYNKSTAAFTPVVAGSVAVSGFTPTSDTEAYGLDVYLAGAQVNLTAAQAASIVTSINSSQTSTGLHAFYIGSPTGGLETSLASSLTTSGDDIVVYTTGTPTNPNGFFNFDFSGFNTTSTIGAVSIGSITAVPEPVSIAGLTVGAVGLMLGRRKRAA